jgi:hypothetical protein
MAVQGAYERNRRRRQRNVNCYIDESLFGGDKTRSGPQKSRRARSAPQQQQEAATRLTTSELFGIQSASIILSSEEKAEIKRQREAARTQKMQTGVLRKQRMMRMEEEKKRRAPVLSETEMLEKEQKTRILAAAKAKMENELDDVKEMNQMMAYAQCVTIRDAQLREKARMKQCLAEFNKNADLEMEVARIRQIRMLEEREVIRQKERQVGARVIIQQIQEREAARLENQAKAEKEAQAMIEKQQELERQEELARQVKMENGRKLLDEVIKSNEQQALLKIRQKQLEAEEDRKIAEYIRQKEAREAAAEMEKERIRAAKELELARMRATQEKAQNRQAQIDELRAKRYQEAKDRAWRQQQLTEARKKQAEKEKIAIVRESQRKLKAQNMAHQALEERTEYERVREWQQRQAEVEASMKQQAKAKGFELRDALNQQIATKEIERRLARQAFLAEGAEAARVREMEEHKLMRIKEQKLSQLTSSGVPQKYTAELAKKKMLVASIH